MWLKDINGLKHLDLSFLNYAHYLWQLVESWGHKALLLLWLHDHEFSLCFQKYVS